MNKNLIKSILPLFGSILSVFLLVGTFRSFIGWTLGSGIFGASFLAILVGVAGVILSVVLFRVSISTLAKIWTSKEQTNENA